MNKKQKKKTPNLHYQFLKKWVKKYELKDLSPAFSSSQQELLRLMESENIDFWYFMFQGNESIHQEKKNFVLEEIYGPRQTKLRQNQPLFWLDQAVSKEKGQIFSQFPRYVSTLLNKVSCMVFPLWNVDRIISLKFFIYFYRRIEKGETIAKAICETRRYLYQKYPNNCSFLSYQVYSHPNTQILLGSSIKFAEERKENKSDNENKPEKSFHSGERLRVLRETRKMTQQEIIDLSGFPNPEMYTSALRRWERNGIPKGKTGGVAESVNLEPWVFLDERITPEQFKGMVLDPKSQDDIKKRLRKK